MWNRGFRGIEKYEITFEELKQKENKEIILLDVRSKQEYSEGHLDGAINIPEYKIDKNIINILTDKNKEIIVYCQNGGRSKKAYRKLKKFGYENIYNLYGGISNIL